MQHRFVVLWALLVGAACGGGDGHGDGGPGDAAVDTGADAGTDAAVDAGPPVIVVEESREACAERDPLRRPFFGEMHIHSALSFDARIFDVRARPADVYRFARGGEIGVPPYDADGNPARRLRLRRPLDFAVVTDHSEYFAEMRICWDPELPGYDSRTCTSYREGDSIALDFGDISGTAILGQPTSLCRGDAAGCARETSVAWAEVQEAAEEAYDRTASCGLTTFVGYEWTGTKGGNNLHRNVIFRNASVPRVPVTALSARNPEGLWQALDETCNDTGTPCEALAIPHNSNLGGGLMFLPETAAGDPYDRAAAERRARLEPLVEITQHKGTSECLPPAIDPLSTDEECAFEVMQRARCTGSPDDPEDCSRPCEEGGAGFLGCIARGDFVRNALGTGLAVEAATGANPFRFGFIGATDGHKGTAGDVEEADWLGHAGGFDTDPALRVGLDNGVAVFQRLNPGGLAVLYAEENSRDALFEAMRRRESYATSGIRPVLRVFGGFDYAETLCDAPDLVAQGYSGGVPMGGVLEGAPSAGAAPTFVVSALRDPMGGLLSHAQVVKGWVDGAGELHTVVVDVAGDAASGASVDPSTCEPTGPGLESLCTVWTDPDFAPDVPAFYYVRLLENPSCRWSVRVCHDLGVDCDVVAADDPLAVCCDPRYSAPIRERAWSSPIWYVP